MVGMPAPAMVGRLERVRAGAAPPVVSVGAFVIEAIDVLVLEVELSSVEVSVVFAVLSSVFELAVVRPRPPVDADVVSELSVFVADESVETVSVAVLRSGTLSS